MSPRTRFWQVWQGKTHVEDIYRPEFTICGKEIHSYWDQVREPPVDPQMCCVYCFNGYPGSRLDAVEAVVEAARTVMDSRKASGVAADTLEDLDGALAVFDGFARSGDA